MPARDERAGLRSGTGVVERGQGDGKPWSEANRALVTAEIWVEMTTTIGINRVFLKI
jgi:hypothetical protein